MEKRQKLLEQLGKEEPPETTDTTTKFVKDTLKELEEKQPGEPEVQVLMSDDMAEDVEKILAKTDKMLEHA